MTTKYPGFIAHIRRYVELSDDEVLKLEPYLRPMELKRREFLLREGEVCRYNCFVEKGCLRMFFNNDKMVEQTTQFAIENWWLSDYFSFARQSPSE